VVEIRCALGRLNSKEESTVHRHVGACSAIYADDEGALVWFLYT
jgi:hypothetical protein